ncbi:MAG: radical SAM protein [Lachnospiraceae bacterium]|nr:radical SAM protein [Lachnospiraceae bacterium]
MSVSLPVFSIARHRLATDGQGVTTLVGAYGCPLQCRYCINPHAWRPSTLERCVHLTPEQLYDKVKIDNLYFLATGGGVTFGGGESLLHAAFIAAFRQVCGPDWRLAVETSLHVPPGNLEQVLGVVDEFIVDIKDLDQKVYASYTGQPQAPLEENLQRLAAYLPPEKVRIRIPRIPGYNTEENIQKSLEKLRLLRFTRLEIFHYILQK